MSRLSDLLRQVEQLGGSQLAADLGKEYQALSGRRAFGLNFERHTPETVELPSRPIRRGDKVRILPPRGEPASASDSRLWRVAQIVREGDSRLAALQELSPGNGAGAESRVVDCLDLVVVAEFRDPIYPGLVSTGTVERGDDKPFHTVINAENFHALQTLLYTHEGQVDAIYMDPPYNTGARDWKYNNDYVDSEDAYRHSKWLAMMERRLKLAKRLLKQEDSVLIVTIDEKEYLRLGLLLEQTFPEAARTQMIASIINPQGVSSGSGRFSRVDEYIFFVMLGTAELTKWSRSMVDNDKEASDVSTDRTVRWADFARYGGSGTRQMTSPGALFPVFVSTETETIHSIGDAVPEGSDLGSVEAPPGTRAVWPPPRSDGSPGRWRVIAPKARELAAKGFIDVGPYRARTGRHSLAYLQSGALAAIERGEIVVTGHDHKGTAIVEYAGNTKTATPKTIWTLPSHDASRHGANLLRQLLGEPRFPFPKSLYAVEDALRFFVKDKPNAVIVDCFAGSGTTAHATMRLNKQDGGTRQSISITNNEVGHDEQADLRRNGLRPGDPDWESLGICDYVTKPRIRAAVTGTTPQGKPIKGEYRFTDEFPMADGFEENVEFLTLTYQAPRVVAHNRAFEAIAPLLWMRAGSSGRRIDTIRETYDIADSYGVLFDLDASREFLEAVAESDDCRVAFIVTDDDRSYQMVVAGLPAHAEPVRLYESYLTNFTINAGVDA